MPSSKGGGGGIYPRTVTPNSPDYFLETISKVAKRASVAQPNSSARLKMILKGFSLVY